jgi:hypothetical protein
MSIRQFKSRLQRLEKPDGLRRTRTNDSNQRRKRAYIHNSRPWTTTAATSCPSECRPPLATPLRQPESRRASTGLRLIGLGKRPSGAAGGSSPLKYIGLGRKRTSAIKYIGLGRRSGEQGFPADSIEADAYEAAIGGDRFQGGHRQRRDVAMRLIGLGRRSEYPPLHRGLSSMSSLDDDDDEFVADGDVLRNAADAAVARQQWHQIKRRAGGSDSNGLRRVQLRRWSSSSSSAGSHVDPRAADDGNREVRCPVGREKSTPEWNRTDC